MADPVLVWPGMLVVAAVLAHSAIAKWRHLGAFEAALAAYGLLPARLVAPVATVLPAVEAATVVLLLLAPTQRLGAAIAAVLLVAFAAAMGTALREGRPPIACGCSDGELHVSGWLVLRNFWLALLLTPMLAGSPAGRALSWLEGLTIAGGALSLFAGHTAASGLLRNRQRMSIA